MVVSLWRELCRIHPVIRPFIHASTAVSIVITMIVTVLVVVIVRTRPRCALCAHGLVQTFWPKCHQSHRHTVSSNTSTSSSSRPSSLLRQTDIKLNSWLDTQDYQDDEG